MEQDFCLKWNNHQQNVITILETLLQRESLVDVTLMADGRMLPAHKFVLSASSPYFENICSQFSDKHTVIVLKDVSYNDMKALLEFMYKGEVKVPADQLGSLVKTAMSLKIKGLGDDNDEEPSTKGPPSPLIPSTQRKATFENSLDSRKERSRPESPISSKPAKKMRLDNDNSVCEVMPHSPENLTSPSENVVTEQPSVENDVNSPNETSTERTSRRSTDTPKLEVKAELQEIASSPEIIEEPMDDYDDTRTDTQGGLMQTLPGTSGTSEEEVYSPWPFTQETSADDSVSLPEGSQDKSSSSSPKHQQETEKQKETSEEAKEKQQEGEQKQQDDNEKQQDDQEKQQEDKENQNEPEQQPKEAETEPEKEKEKDARENHQDDENDVWEAEPEPEVEPEDEEEIDVEKQHEEQERQQDEQRKLLETVKQQLEQEQIIKQKLEQEKFKQEQIIKQQLEQGKLKQERMLKQQAEREKIRQEQMIKQQLEQQKLRMEQQKHKQDLIIKQQQQLIKTQQQQLLQKQQQLEKQQQFQRQQQFQKQQQLQKQQQFQRQQQLQKQQQMQRQQQLQMQNRQQFQQRQQIPQVQQQQSRPRMTAAQVVAASSSIRPRVKRPMNAYMLWAQNERMKVSQQCPDLSVADVSKILGVRWNAMTHDEKKPFYEEHNRLQKLHMETNPGFQFLRPQQQQQQRPRGVRPMMSPQQQRLMMQNRPRMEQARAMMRQRLNPRFNPVISNIRAVGPRMVKPEIKLIEEISLDDDDDEEDKLANIKRESVEGGMEVEVEEFQGVDMEKKVSTEEMRRILMKREIVEEEDEFEDPRDVKNVLLIRPDVDEVETSNEDSDKSGSKEREPGEVRVEEMEEEEVEEERKDEEGEQREEESQEEGGTMMEEEKSRSVDEVQEEEELEEQDPLETRPEDLE